MPDPAYDHGFLKVFVTTATSALPLSDALVTVSQQQNGQTVLLHTLHTDSSGQTPEVSLQTPPLSYSETPGNPTPFSMYIVDTSVPGYVPVSKYEVPVFPQTHAILPVQMIPLGVEGQPPVFVSPAGNRPNL